MFDLFTTVFADPATAGAGTGSQQQGGVAGTIMSLAPILILLVLMYFMLIRPQKKQQKEMQKMLSALTVGDKVVTIGGICGKVVKIKDEFVWIETGKNTDEGVKSCLKFERSAVKSVDKKIEE